MKILHSPREPRRLTLVTMEPSRRHGRRRAPPRRNSRGRDRAARMRSKNTSERTAPAGHAAVHLSDDVVEELRATARPGKADIAIKVLSEAAAAFAEEDYSTAIRLGEQAKHMALRSVSARELLGLAYYRAGRWQEAARELAAFKRISGTTDQNPVLADCHRAMGKPQRALELCDEIDERSSSPAVAYEAAIVAAGALADMDRLDDAIRRLERLDLRPAVAEAHHVRLWYMLADLLERRGRYTQAKEWFSAAAAADPDLTDAPERASRLRTR
jgi:tetratricopeptide (TPR) repeat protein